jgi:hypothetical protein
MRILIMEELKHDNAAVLLQILSSSLRKMDGKILKV